MTGQFEFIHVDGCALSPNHKGDCRKADGSWGGGEWNFAHAPKPTPPERYAPESLNALHWVAGTGRCNPTNLKGEHFALAVADGLITQETGVWQPTPKGDDISRV